MATRRNYMLLAGLFVCIFLLRLLVLLLAGSSFGSTDLIELSNWGALAFMGCSIAYLLPQFKNNDERVKMIKQKGLYYVILFSLLCLVILNIFIQTEVLALTSLEVVRLLLSIIIIAVWTSWIILSKRL
ncbi:hypothetical protein [Bacillus infantis]|uniref:Permease n=1 Tax=Bacillus infantis TaxID=324767 RepID=A0A5D4RQQ2_9BACI|nr:hypothetical protein [Bacillus infantis]TYS52044.1 hypothetical protein FZD51_00930 [Bacillus infantis]